MTRPAPTLRTRLVLGNLVLILTALAITWAVATLAGPPLFRDHIKHKSDLPAAVLERVEQAFHIANLLQVLLASVLALALTLAANVLISRTISARIGEITTLTAGIAAGNYTTRLPQRHTSRELDTLTTAVNDMAATLQHTEATRRRLLTDVAHELRTPIATIDGYLEAIDDGVEVADTETIELLRRQVRRVTRLAEDLRAVSAADEERLRIERSAVPVNELSQHVMQVAQPAFAAKDVELRLLADSHATVFGDPTRLEQVLTNVLNNALRHTPAGGTVTVSARAAGNGLTLSVADTGEGIDRSHLPHLFERFYRAHVRDDEQGSGVGLTISRAIIAAHGGTITVDSPGTGRGTTVTITLPLGNPAVKQTPARRT
jgi:two-component system, OmpR family, sensor histidine kinase BaeS